MLRATILIWMILCSFFALAQDKRDPLEDSIQLQADMKNVPKALSFALLFAEKVKKTKGENDFEYGRALSKLGLWYVYNNMPEEAEKALTKALAIQTTGPRAKPEHIANTWYAWGMYWQALNQFDKQLECFQNRLAEETKAYGEGSKQVAMGLTQVGIAKYSLGDFSAADADLLQALEIYKKLEMMETKECAELYRYLGIVNKDMGNFQKVDQYFNLAFPLCLKIYGEIHPKTGEAYNNLGAAASFLGNNEKALSYFLKGLEIRKKTQGEESDEVGQSYLNLANLYETMGNIEECLKSQQLAIRLLTKSRGENSEFVAFAYLNAGTHLIEMGQFHQALTYLRKAQKIIKSIHGEEHPEMGSVVVNLVDLFNKCGRPDSALYYGKKGISLWKKQQSPSFFGFIVGYSNVGMVLFNQRRYAEALPYFKLGNEVFLKHISENFPSLSDSEKEEFYNSISGNVEDFKSFCAKAGNSVASVPGELFDFQLATKGLLLNSSAKWKHRIKHSGDVKLFGQYSRWLEYQKQIQSIQQSGDSAQISGLDSLTQKAKSLEKELSLRSEGFAKLADRRKYSWRDVEKKLKQGEASIEIIRTHKYGVVKANSVDTSDALKKRYHIKGLTDSIQYVALILKPGLVWPEMVLLPDGNTMEEMELKFYQKCIQSQIQNARSYSIFWEKINNRLQGIRKVYFSPDGVYHNINLNTLWNPKTRKYILEEKDINILTTTKELLLTNQEETEGKVANLVGFPTYYSQPYLAQSSENTRKSPQLNYILRWQGERVLSELPSTRTEVENIEKVLKESGWEVQTFLADKALEENLKEAYKPNLLHIATHGFFQPDTSNKQNPLLSSGLMLTGSGNTLKGQTANMQEDGILTAYEAMNLNLDNTDLVVLSACETGLGEVRNGEGVYGLQRAFKVAGARSLIMSLWKVDDDATQELMVSFYKHWASPSAPLQGRGEKAPHGGLGAGASKRSAFLAAQKELKAKYPNPYYWGAFVMVGE
jgi:CHAT domain-containing protein/tetratricopeptide (TPR) repeat protein